MSPSTISNPDLNTEEAFSQEVGVKFTSKQLSISLAAFNRDADNLIDYVREDISSPWQAQNIQSVATKGYETNLEYRFFLNQLLQKLQFGYSYLDNEVKKSEANFSQYSINSMKHQFVGNYAMEWFKNFSNSVSYRYVERTSGVSYNIWDVNASYRLKAVELSLYANNIFNTEYVETGMVPMPNGNILFGLKYYFK